MHTNENKIEFIQPLPFTLKKAKELLKKHKRKLRNSSNSFKFKEEILHYLPTTLEFDSHTFNAHLFFNEKAEIEQKHHFLKVIFDFEDKLNNKKFNTLKEYLTYRDSNIPNKLVDYFKWNRTTLFIEKNMKAIKKKISKMGCFILLSNTKMNKVEILDYYRQRDGVEKIFDIVKNAMDGNRLRAHSQYNTDGRLFMKFIALIVYTELSKIMNENSLFKKYSVKELLFEMKKLKIVKIKNNELFLSELSKKQKMILKAFGIKEASLLHSY
jgi:hypothetical protein